jgi:pimeloyl-ACP methyl ester carboxylesterase
MTIHYERRGEGEPLVLIHHIGGSWKSWEAVIRPLAEERDVIALDMPGFGRSPPLPSGVEPTAARLAAEISLLFDRLGLDRPAVAGHSLGGWVALELAAMGRTGPVAALAPAGLWANRRQAMYSSEQLRQLAVIGEKRLRPIVRNRVGRSVALWTNHATPWRMPARTADGIITRALRAPGMMDTLNAMAKGRFERWEEVDVPVTFIWGDRERLIYRPCRDRATAMLPHSRTFVLERCGHLVPWERPLDTVRLLLGGPGPARADLAADAQPISIE